MPRIAKRYLQCVGYIYPDKESAQSDKPHGGSGFIVARQVDGGIQTFVITNLHVIDKLPNPVIRLNRVTLEPELFLTNRARWIAHPEGDDLAAYQLDVSPDDYKHVWISESAFWSPDNDYVGLGTDVAMLGRFIGLNGQVEVSPTARFGAIASPTTVTRINTFNKSQDTIVIECHSVSGFSGSPVIAFLPSGALNEAALDNSGLGPWLIGVVYMHFGSPDQVLDEDDQKIGAYIKGNSGLAGVIPAWKIKKLLDCFPPTISTTF